MKLYTTELDGEMVIVHELDTDTNLVTQFQFDRHVFERAVGIDVLLGTCNLEEDENFLDLLEQDRE
jgi:hypothetical protein